MPATGHATSKESMPDLVPRLKAALRGLPGPVALITTRDAATGEPAGLAASAVIPVSMDPPSMLVCVNRSASAHAIIESCGCFCINLVGRSQIPFVDAFSSSAQRNRRFVADVWSDRNGLPYLSTAPAGIFCRVRTTLLFGTHEAFVGEVFDVVVDGAEKPLGWIDGSFAQFSPISSDDKMPADAIAQDAALRSKTTS